eukprot:2945689-Rhodomonas_salina.3
MLSHSSLHGKFPTDTWCFERGAHSACGALSAVLTRCMAGRLAAVVGRDRAAAVGARGRRARARQGREHRAGLGRVGRERTRGPRAAPTVRDGASVRGA